jgi:hypothetical protein
MLTAAEVHLPGNPLVSSGDKLRAGAILLPPIILSKDSIALLSSIWP